MSIFFDNSKALDNLKAISCAKYITDLSFDKASKTVSIRKATTIPYLGRLFSWLIFTFSSQAAIEKSKENLLAFQQDQTSSYHEQIVKDVDALFQECRPSFSDAIAQLKSLKGSLRLFPILASKYVALPDVEDVDELQDRMKKELRVLCALDKGEVTAEMNISIKVLFNLGQILAETMSVERQTSFRNYIPDMDISDRSINSMVPVFKKCEQGPYRTVVGYLFDESEMSYYSFREHIREEINNSIRLSIRKADDVFTKLQDWKAKFPAIVDDKIEKFFKLNTKLVKPLNDTQKARLEHEMTQIYSELFPQVIDAIALSIKA